MDYDIKCNVCIINKEGNNLPLIERLQLLDKLIDYNLRKSFITTSKRSAISQQTKSIVEDKLQQNKLYLHLDL